MNIYQFLLFLLKYYCVASSSPPLSPEGPYSLVSTIYFIRLHARSYVTPLILRATKPGADDLENPWQRVFFCLLLFLSILGLLLDFFFPPLSPSGAIATLHAQTSRNVTGFCHRDCGGALSAVLTCTGRTLHASVKLYTQKQNEGIACFPHSPPSSPTLHWNHRDFGLRFSHAARFILCLLCLPVTQQSSK